MMMHGQRHHHCYYGWVEDAGNLYGSIESYTTIKSGLRQTVSPTREDKEYKPSPLPDEWETHKDSYGTVVTYTNSR